jgi:hypothetical protein
MICHKEGTPAQQTLVLPDAAAAGHVADHGDTHGPCPITATVGAGGGRIEVDDRGSPLDGAVVDIPPGALDADTTVTLEHFGAPELTDAIGPLPAPMTFVAGIAISTSPSDGDFAKPVAVSLVNRAGATADDQLLVGSVTELPGGGPSRLLYRGLARLGSIEFTAGGTGQLAVLTPAEQVTLAPVRLLRPNGDPIAGGLVVASGAEPFFGITGADGGLAELPIGPAGRHTLVLGESPDLQALAAQGFEIPRGPIPVPLLERLTRLILEQLEVDVPSQMPSPPSGSCPTLIVDSHEQHPAQTGSFRLVTRGPPLTTFLLDPLGGVYEAGGLSIPGVGSLAKAVLDGRIRVVTSVEFVTTDLAGNIDPTVAAVGQRTGILGGQSPGRAFEVGTATMFGVQVSQGYPLPVFLPPCTAAAPVEVAPPLTLDLSGVPSGEVGVPYSGRLSATGGWPNPGAAPHRFSLGGSLPPGLAQVDPATGEIAGIPTAAGQFALIAEATDGNNPQTVATEPFTLTIVGPVDITTGSPLPDGTVGASYGVTLQAAGGEPPFEWSLESGNLPPGLSLEETGALHGVPTVDGSFSFTVLVTDALGGTATETFDLRVNPPPNLLFITVDSVSCSFVPVSGDPVVSGYWEFVVNGAVAVPADGADYRIVIRMTVGTAGNVRDPARGFVFWVSPFFQWPTSTWTGTPRIFAGHPLPDPATLQSRRFRLQASVDRGFVGTTARVSTGEFGCP